MYGGGFCSRPKYSKYTIIFNLLIFIILISIHCLVTKAIIIIVIVVVRVVTNVLQTSLNYLKYKTESIYVYCVLFNVYTYISCYDFIKTDHHDIVESGIKHHKSNQHQPYIMLNTSYTYTVKAVLRWYHTLQGDNSLKSVERFDHMMFVCRFQASR